VPLLLELSCRPPLGWDALLAYLGPRAIPGVERVEGGVYRRTLGPHPVWLEARPAARGRGVALHVHGLRRVPPAARREDFRRRATRLFGLDADPRAVSRRLARDPLLAPILARQRALRVPGAWDGFELAVRAVLGQQVSVRAATTFAGRLVAACGRPLAPGSAPEGLTHLFPPPADLARADLAPVGLTSARQATLRTLGAAAADGLRLDPEAPRAATLARLRALPGIGAWTADYVALRALRDPDALPDGDLGLRRALQRDGRPLSAAALRAAAEAWRPWRGYAALALWRHDAAGAGA
jgi:AraC family transcriptional regulator of adaptative response / DNA-3-methyladenine glycosylase II